MSCIMLEHCTLWDGTSPEIREDMHVLVEEERIREISERSIAVPQAQVIDCQGKTLMTASPLMEMPCKAETLAPTLPMLALVSAAGSAVSTIRIPWLRECL